MSSSGVLESDLERHGIWMEKIIFQVLILANIVATAGVRFASANA